MAKLDQININGVIHEIVPEIAPLFDASTAYAVGDYVIKDAMMYRFKTAHAAGAWNASQVDEVTVGSEIKDIKQATSEIDALKADIGDLSELETEDKSSLVGAINEAVQSGGGISSVAQSLLINILRNGLYENDQSTNIGNLKIELASGGGGGEKVAIVNNLTNCTNSNTAISADIGSSYMGTITANEGYDMDSVTVTMDGNDVTSSVVFGNAITISSVTGAINITATAMPISESGLVHYWDFTSGSLVDTVDTETTATKADATSIASETGITIASATDWVTVPWGSTSGIIRAKIKFGAINREAFGYERLIGIKSGATSTPIVALRYNNSNSIWETGTGAHATDLTDPNALANKEVEMTRNRNAFSIVVDGQTIVDSLNPGMSWQYLEVGGSQGSAFRTIEIKSIKMYESA